MVKPTRKRKASRDDDALSLCNVAGFDASVFGEGDIGEMDCLEAMAVAQCAPNNHATTNVNTDGEESTIMMGRSLINHFSKSNDSLSLPPEPPGFHCIPNARIELARHLLTQSLSSFVLESCPGLRMPTFERWLLDSKLEETERFEDIIKDWQDDPRLVHNDAGTKTKKKYGRAAKYHQKQMGDKEKLDVHYEREKSRYEKECGMLSELKKSRSSQQQRRIPWTQLVYRDPILPHAPLETDPSCIRLSEELFVMVPSIDNNCSDGGRRGKATDIVRDLCHRASEARKEIRNLEQRLGRYQKFAWWDGDATRNKKSKKSVDKVIAEWHDTDKSVFSLTFVTKKRTSSHRPASQTGGFRESGDGDVAANPHTEQSNKPKPFVIKINTLHYNKLRAMFDSCYRGLADAATTTSKSKEQTTHAFHVIVFCLVIRYSSLSGGQLINDWRGGGMQGAVHDTVFDCFSKWFGGGNKSSLVGGTECFASPFNSTLSRYYSAFPSPDLDGHFASCGDFFQMPLSDTVPGWFEINPPFSPFVMTKMAKRIIELMETQVWNDVDVTCIVIIPTVRSNATKSKQIKITKARKQLMGKGGEVLNDDTPSLMSIVNHAAKQSFDMLINSPYCKSHIILPAQEHGFIEGGQHLRNTKYKESQCKTSVIVLRSQEWSDAEDAKMFDKEIRIAFASRHAIEVENARACRSKTCNTIS